MLLTLADAEDAIAMSAEVVAVLVDPSYLLLDDHLSD
jgi:hypothetical protein